MFDLESQNPKARRNKRIKSISLYLLIACMVVIIFLSSFSALLFNQKFYDYEYKKNGVYDRYGSNMTLNATENIFSFFKDKEDIGHGLGGFFTDNEKSHMYDVKVVVNSALTVYHIAIALSVILFCIIFFMSWNMLLDFGKMFLFAGLICLFMILAFYTLNFDFIFMKFHETFFSGNYIFPETSNLIGLFPMQFFGDIAYRIVFFSLVKAIVFIIAGTVILISASAALSKYKPKRI